MTTDLATTEKPLSARDLSPEQVALIAAVAPTLHQCRYYAGVSSPEQAAWLMARAYELGFPLTAGPETIEAIQGRPSLKPIAAWALVMRSGKLEDMVVDEGDGYCEIRVKRRDLPFWFGYKFTRSMAIKADLVKPGGAYEKWEQNMYYWRTLGFVIDRAFSDVTLGLKDTVQWGDELPMRRVNTDTGEILVADTIEGEVLP